MANIPTVSIGNIVNPYDDLKSAFSGISAYGQQLNQKEIQEAALAEKYMQGQRGIYDKLEPIALEKTKRDILSSTAKNLTMFEDESLSKEMTDYREKLNLVKNMTEEEYNKRKAGLGGGGLTYDAMGNLVKSSELIGLDSLKKKANEDLLRAEEFLSRYENTVVNPKRYGQRLKANLLDAGVPEADAEALLKQETSKYQPAAMTDVDKELMKADIAGLSERHKARLKALGDQFDSGKSSDKSGTNAYGIDKTKYETTRAIQDNMMSEFSRVGLGFGDNKDAIEQANKLFNDPLFKGKVSYSEVADIISSNKDDGLLVVTPGDFEKSKQDVINLIAAKENNPNFGRKQMSEAEYNKAVENAQSQFDIDMANIGSRYKTVNKTGRDLLYEFFGRNKKPEEITSKAKTYKTTDSTVDIKDSINTKKQTENNKSVAATVNESKKEPLKSNFEKKVSGKSEEEIQKMSDSELKSYEKPYFGKEFEKSFSENRELVKAFESGKSIEDVGKNLAKINTISPRKKLSDTDKNTLFMETFEELPENFSVAQKLKMLKEKRDADGGVFKNPKLQDYMDELAEERSGVQLAKDAVKGSGRMLASVGTSIAKDVVNLTKNAATYGTKRYQDAAKLIKRETGVDIGVDSITEDSAKAVFQYFGGIENKIENLNKEQIKALSDLSGVSEDDISKTSTVLEFLAPGLAVGKAAYNTAKGSKIFANIERAKNIKEKKRVHDLTMAHNKRKKSIEDRISFLEKKQERTAKKQVKQAEFEASKPDVVVPKNKTGDKTFYELRNGTVEERAIYNNLVKQQRDIIKQAKDKSSGKTRTAINKLEKQVDALYSKEALEDNTYRIRELVEQIVNLSKKR